MTVFLLGKLQELFECGKHNRYHAAIECDGGLHFSGWQLCRKEFCFLTEKKNQVACFWKRIQNSHWITWKLTMKGKKIQCSLLITRKVTPKASNVPSQDVWKFTPVSYRTSALWGRCPALTPLLQLITPSRALGTADHVRSLDDFD